MLNTTRRLGLVLAPEVVQWDTPLFGGPPITDVLQKRICFTELEMEELAAHSSTFGPFAYEFDIDVLRRLGALPVVYMPQTPPGDNPLGVVGPFIVSHMKVIDRLLGILRNFEQDLMDKAVSKDCVITLNNVDNKGKPVSQYKIPCSALIDLISFLRFGNPQFSAMMGATSIVESLFYPADNEHVGDPLGYYRQREWRITGGYSVNNQPRGRLLQDHEKRDVIRTNPEFWEGKITYKDRRTPSVEKTVRRIDDAEVLCIPGPDDLFQMMKRLIVPEEMEGEAQRLLGDVVKVATLT